MAMMDVEVLARLERLHMDCEAELLALHAHLCPYVVRRLRAWQAERRR